MTLIAQTLNPFNGFLGIPLSLFLPLNQVYNTLVAFAFVATGLTTFWLAWHASRHYWASVFTGFAFTFSSFHFMRAYGHLDLLSIEWVPLFVLMWIRLLDEAKLRFAAGAAIALLLVKWCNDYYLFYCVLAGLLLVVHRTFAQRDVLWLFRRERILPVLAFVALSAVLVLPLLVALLIADRDDPFRGAHDATKYGLDLLAPFIPTAHWRFADWTRGYWEPLHHNAIESASYLRWSVLLPALWAVTRLRRLPDRHVSAWVTLAIVFFLLALDRSCTSPASLSATCRCRTRRSSSWCPRCGSRACRCG